MAELILRQRRLMNGSAGREYDVIVFGRVDDGGRWEGWLEFRPTSGGLILRTERETTQASRDALTYWASGLGTTYLEGAFERAFDHTSQT